MKHSTKNLVGGMHKIMASMNEQARDRLFNVSTHALEVYLLAQLFVWVVWLVFVDKKGVMIPFWRALNTIGDVTIWVVWALIIICVTLAGSSSKRFAIMRLFSLGLGLTYWAYLSIIVLHAMPTALLPWLGLLTTTALFWCFLHRLVTVE